MRDASLDPNSQSHARYQDPMGSTSYIASKKAKDAVYTLLLSAIGAEMHV